MIFGYHIDSVCLYRRVKTARKNGGNPRLRENALRRQRAAPQPPPGYRTVLRRSRPRSCCRPCFFFSSAGCCLPVFRRFPGHFRAEQILFLKPCNSSAALIYNNVCIFICYNQRVHEHGIKPSGPSHGRQRPAGSGTAFSFCVCFRPSAWL